MASGDPKIGQQDTWAKDPIILSTTTDQVPTLYHTDTSYFSQIGRLVLEESGLQWRSRHVDIHGINEHLQPWYLTISPGGCVPTLVHCGRPVPESRDISYYVGKMEGCVSLVGVGEGSVGLLGEGREEVDRMVELHYTVSIEDLTMGRMLGRNPVMKYIFLRKMGAGLTNLEALEADNKNPDIAETIAKKLVQRRGHLDRFGTPDKLYSEAHPTLSKVLDTLQQRLVGGPFICGEAYSLADVMFTCMLARLNMIGALEEELAPRPLLSAWWSRMRARESFVKAGIVEKPPGVGTIAQKFCAIL